MSLIVPAKRAAAPAVAIALVLLALTVNLMTRHSVSFAFTSIPMGNGDERITWVMPGGYGWDRGLRAGDLVRVSNEGETIEILSGARAGETLSVGRPWSQSTDLLLITIGLEFLAAGLIVYWRGRDRYAAKIMLIFTTVACVTLILSAATSSDSALVTYLSWAATKLACAALLCFFSLVPINRWRAFRRLVIGLLPPLLAVYSYCFFIDPGLYNIVKVLGFSYMALAMGGGLAALIWPLIAKAPSAQRQFWPVALSVAIASLLFLLGSIIPYIFTGHYLIKPVIAILAIGLVPVAFVYSMLRYRLLGIDLRPWGLLKTVLETAVDPILVVANDGRLVDASQSGLRLLGIEIIDAKNDAFRNVIKKLDDSSSGIASVLLRVLAGNTIRDEEHTLWLANGQELLMSVSGTPVFTNEQNVGVAVLILRDITERKRLEEQSARAERLELAGRIASQVAHDFNNLLGPLVGYPKMIKRQLPPNHPASKLCDHMYHAALEMMDINTDMMTLGRMGLLDTNPVDVAKVVHQVKAELGRLPAGQRIETNVAENLLPVLGSASQLHRVLCNIVANARDALAKEGIIQIGAENVYCDLPVDGYERISKGEYVKIWVQDNGHGIPPEIQNKVFEPFFTTKKGRGLHGTGLGLSIVQAVVKNHRGFIDLHSEVGKGTCVSIYLPAMRSKPNTENDRNPTSLTTVG
jgi:PAS domain S-box-containing protein